MRSSCFSIWKKYSKSNWLNLQFGESNHIWDRRAEPLLPLRMTSKYFLPDVKFCPIPCIRLWWLSQIPYMLSGSLSILRKKILITKLEKLLCESDLFPLPGSKDKSCVNIKSGLRDISNDFKRPKMSLISPHFWWTFPDSVERAGLFCQNTYKKFYLTQLVTSWFWELDISQNQDVIIANPPQLKQQPKTKLSFF